MKLLGKRSVAILVITLIQMAAGGADAEERASVPPGQSRDGSRPSEGAIVGGSTDPATDNKPGRGTDAAAQKGIDRCNQLRGDLRDQCVRDLEGKKPVGKDEDSGKR